MTKKAIIINVVGGIAAIGLVIFPEPSSLTTWQQLAEQAKSFINNPYQIGLALVACYGYITNLK